MQAEESSNMTIREFSKREEKRNIGLADKLRRSLNIIEKSEFRDSRIMAAYEIRGMLFALLYSRYITSKEFESLTNDWDTISKMCYRSSEIDKLYADHEKLKNELKSDSVLNKLHSNQEKLKNAEPKGEEKNIKREEIQK